MALIFEQCLAKAVADEAISESTARRYKKLYDDFVKEGVGLNKLEGSVENYTYATSKAAERMFAQVGETKRSIAREILNNQLLMTEAQGHTAGLYEGLRAILGEDRRGGGGLGRGLWRNKREALAAIHSMNTHFIEQLRSKNFGLTRDRVAPRDTTKEIFGSDSGNAGAKINAQGWQKTLDWWLEMMADAGVMIRKLDDWRMPQEFNVARLKNMGIDNFTNAMTERWQSGGLRLRDFKSEADNALLRPGVDDDRVTDILRGAYESITTSGSNRIEPGITTHESMADKYNRRRVFEWTTAESYFDFADTFGNGANNLGEAFTRHLRQMADDLGTAQVLGNNAEKTKDTLLQFGQKNGIDAANIRSLEKLYFHASGQAAEAVRVTVANTMQGVRSGLSAVQLGGAVLSSLSDFATLRSTASFNGLGSVKVLRQYLAEAVGGKDARRHATQMALINESGLRGLRDHVDEVMTANPGGMFKGEGMEAASAGWSRMTGQAAEFVMRATGLEAHSSWARNGWGKGQLANLADHADVAFDALPERLGSFLQRYGIDASDWDVLRTRAMDGERLFMDPAFLAYEGKIAERKTALKLIGAIDAESRYAVPEGGPTTQAMMLGKTRPGEFSGEMARSVQYKGFALSLTVMHGYRALDQLMNQTGFMARTQYIMALSLEAVVLGALSYQLKNIAGGRDLEAMDTHNFWLKAAATGGVGGMLGDQLKTLFQTKSLADATRLMTPTTGFAVDTGTFLFGNLAQIDAGEKTNFGREAVRYGQKYSPTQVAGRLFYTRLAMDRLAWETLQRMVDPDAGKAFHRTEQRSRKETGTEYWWRPGQTEPFRGPEMSRQRNLEALTGQ